MTPKLNAYNFDITFLMPQFTTITIASSSMEEATKKVEDLLKEFEKGRVINSYPLDDAPVIKSIIEAKAEMMGVDIYKEIDEVLEPVHDTKELN